MLNCLKKINVLVTASGLSPVGIDTVTSLRGLVGKIIGVDVDHGNIAKFFVDQFFSVPLAKRHKWYLKSIVSICRQKKVKVILPLTIEELLVCLKNIKIFNDLGVRIAGENNYNTVLTCNDKFLTNQFLKLKSVPVPMAYSCSSESELIFAAKALGYPAKKIVFKPRVAHGSRGFRVLSENYSRVNQLVGQKYSQQLFISLNELRSIFIDQKKFPAVMLMDFLLGDDFSVYCFCDTGRVLSVVPLARFGLNNGVTSGGIIKKDEAVINYVTEIVNFFKFSGAINIQLIKTANGPLVYEINTRVSGTTCIVAAAGLNYPFLLLLQAIGQTKEVERIINRTRIKWHLSLNRIYDNLFFKQSGIINFYESVEKNFGCRRPF